jgi:alpha-galactosidase
MIVAVSTPGYRSPWRWAGSFGQLWRIGRDTLGTWENVIFSADADAPLWPYAGRGRWNDPDVLQVGSSGLTRTEERTQFSLWSVLAAPLLEGQDLTGMPGAGFATLANDEVIAVDQDPAGWQGRRVRSAGGIETWVRPLADGSWAALFVNRNSGARRIAVTAAEIPGLPTAERYRVRDLWAHSDAELRSSGVQMVDLARHGAAMWRIRALPPG